MRGFFSPGRSFSRVRFRHRYRSVSELKRCLIRMWVLGWRHRCLGGLASPAPSLLSVAHSIFTESVLWACCLAVVNRTAEGKRWEAHGRAGGLWSGRAKWALDSTERGARTRWQARCCPRAGVLKPLSISCLSAFPLCSAYLGVSSSSLLLRCVSAVSLLPHLSLSFPRQFPSATSICFSACRRTNCQTPRQILPQNWLFCTYRKLTILVYISVKALLILSI